MFKPAENLSCMAYSHCKDFASNELNCVWNPELVYTQGIKLVSVDCDEFYKDYSSIFQGPYLCGVNF